MGPGQGEKKKPLRAEFVLHKRLGLAAGKVCSAGAEGSDPIPPD